MSAPGTGGVSGSKAPAADKNTESKDVKPTAALEEDDEFEDFPVESRFYPRSHVGKEYMGARGVGWGTGG